jgi:integrase
MSEPTLMVRFKRDGKWPRVKAAYGQRGNPKQGWILTGIDKDGNEVHQELKDPYRYEIRIEGPSGTRYKSAGVHAVDAENMRREMAGKKAVKDAGEELGLVVVDPADLLAKRVELRATGDDYIEYERKKNALEAMEQSRVVIDEFLSMTKLRYVDQVNRDSILNFDDALRKIGRKPRTIRNKRQRLHSWLRFAGVTDPEIFPPKPRAQKELPQIYQRQQIKALFSVSDPYQHLAISLMLKLGLRDGEAQHAEWTDINWDDHTLHVQCKPRYDWSVKDYEDRLIPIGDDLYAELKEWREAHPKTVLIIPTRSDRPNGKLLAIVKRLARKAKIECGKCSNCIKGVKGQLGCDEYYLHRFRATYITSLFRRGVDPVTIMQYAGHADLETTLRYARPAAAEDRIAAVSGIDWEGND